MQIQKSIKTQSFTSMSHEEDKSIAHYDSIDDIRKDIIGRDHVFFTPFGPRKLLYADFTASGRLMGRLETYMNEVIYPNYGNTHTTTDLTGAQTTLFREEARSIIEKCANLSQDDVALFVGNGVTGCIELALKVLHARSRKSKICFVHGPAEHHSNILPWREFFPDHTYSVPLLDKKGLDVRWFQEMLPELSEKYDEVFCSFSVASNVTGIIEPTSEINAIAHQFQNCRIFWDYATGGPYLKIDFNPPKGRKYAPDGVYLSIHKFLGGPGAPGILLARRDFFDNEVPTMPGGGTVVGVTKDKVMYENSIEHREESGTPNIVGSIRAAFAMDLKFWVGTQKIAEIEEAHTNTFIKIIKKCKNVRILGDLTQHRVPVFSFIVYTNIEKKKVLHHNFVSILLNDLFGIQSRGGCACAGPLAIDLLEIESPNEMLDALGRSGMGFFKPGFCRMNLHWTFTQAEVEYLAKAIVFVAENGMLFFSDYKFDYKSGSVSHRSFNLQMQSLFQPLKNDVKNMVAPTFEEVLKHANDLIDFQEFQSNSTIRSQRGSLLNLLSQDDLLAPNFEMSKKPSIRFLQARDAFRMSTLTE